MPRQHASAPAWLTQLRASADWRHAHTALDDGGIPVPVAYPWAPPGIQLSFDAYLDSLRTRFGDRTAITDYSQVRFSSAGEPDRPPSVITYGELLAIVARHRQHLLARGTGPWDHVLICLPNRLETLTIQYAAWSLGAVVSPINADQKDRIADILHSTDDLVESGTTVRRVVFVDVDPSAFAAGYGLDPESVIHVDTLATQPGPGTPAETPSFDDPVLILHTSGTTGRPKGAMLSPAGLLTAAIALDEGFELTANDRFLMVNPLFHINSIAFALGVFSVGARVVIPPFGMHWQTAAAEQITFTSMVQRHLTPIVSPTSAADRRNLRSVDRLLSLGTLKWIAVGSGPLAPEIQARLLDMGILVLFRWGMSENYLGSTNMRPGYPAEYYRARLGSTGPSNRYLNLAVRDAEGAVRPRGRGRLLQRGNILIAYSTPEASADAFATGWHDTGDIAEITAEDHVYIVGRTKETIIRSGENIYPQDVDNHLLTHPKVVIAQTVGFPEPDHSEDVGAFVVVDDDVLAERELAEHASALGHQKRPKKLVVIAPEHERQLLKYSGPGKPQRLLNQLTFWRMHFLDEAARLLAHDGALKPGAIATSVPHGEGVALLILSPRDCAEIPVHDDLPDLSEYLIRGSRLSRAELERVLGMRGLCLRDLHPDMVWHHGLSLDELAAARRLNRAGLARAYARVALE